MARRLILCLDGTGNEIGTNLSNVLKLYRVIGKGALANGDEQLVWYDPGVGTIGQPDWFRQIRQQTRAVLGLALGLGLDDNVLDAYSWLCRNWREGDEIWLFGFSRGAYTARVLAGFIHLIGLLGEEQLNLCGYALVAYKKAGDKGEMEIGRDFARVAGTRAATIRFVGVWDTVASVLTPNSKLLFLPWPMTLPFTRANPSVATFRHAISIDERRRMFRLNHWKDPQPFRPAGDHGEEEREQDIRQVWFAGVHSDVGGGYPEVESGLSKYPLLWMIREAEAAGLAVDEALAGFLAAGGEKPSQAHRHQYVPPDATAEIHKSLTGAWWLFEPFPKLARLREWPRRLALLGLYIPWAEPRPIPNRPWKGKPPREPFLVHSSVLARIGERADYRPVNLPATFEVEQTAGPPPPPIPAPPYRTPGALTRLLQLLRRPPSGSDWLRFVKQAAWLLPFLALLAWWGGFGRWDPQIGIELLPVAAAAILFPALAEEAVFRGLLLKPPADGASGLGPAALSALLFALYHPLQTLAYEPRWAEHAWSWTFLLACAALGFVCARLVLAARSLWPAVALHWLVVVLWKGLFDAPL